MPERIVTIRCPDDRVFDLGLSELFQHQRVVAILVWRDVKIRYRRTFFGAGWAVLQPFATMVVFSVIFGHFIGVPSEGLPYPVFAYAGLLPWTFFAQSFNQASTGVARNSSLLSKVYLPKLAIPVSSVIAVLPDFLVAFLVLLAMMAWYGIVPSLAILTLPIFLGFAALTALGVGLWLSALDVRFRDVRYTFAFVQQLWFYATPVVYPSSVVDNPVAAAVLSLNPMAGVTTGFRWALLGGAAPALTPLLISVAAVIAVFVTGALVFRRVARTAIDHL